MAVFTCSNPTSWHPTIHRIEVHHNPPRSWTTDDGASSDLWSICGLCHNEIHALLNEYVRAKGMPSWEIRRSYGPWIRDRAQESWDDRRLDTSSQPYTTSRGLDPDQ